MAGLGISQLPPCDSTYLPDLNTEREGGTIRFETEHHADSEDLLRARLLSTSARKHAKSLDTDLALMLSDDLARAVTEGMYHSTIASSRTMRMWRCNIGGELWRLKYKEPHLPQAMTTIIPKAWEISADDLMLFDPVAALNSLRNMLNRRGASESNGYLLGSIHGEFDPVLNVWLIHFHAITAGEMTDVVDGLRHSRKLRQGLPADDDLPPKLRPVQIKRTLDNLPEPLTYCFQAWWPERTYMSDDNGGIFRGPRRRIGEPYHSMLLLWFNCYRLEDVSLMMGLRVTKCGLKLT